ncbi:MAG: iron uptake system protein EfeO [Acidimicrobiales bacterium]
MTSRARALLVLPALALLAGLAACTDKEDAASSGGGAIEVSSTAEACELSATEAPAGAISFEVTNDGSEVTEFYFLEGERIVSEVENVGPGLTRTLVVEAEPGEYTAQCKPGMEGDGISEAFTVTEGDEAAAADDPKVAALLDEATRGYRSYVADEVATLQAKTQAFATAYAEGRDDEARASYADARVHWERIEPVAESFGDLDPKLDLREADLEDGQTWTGWHRIEKDLWPPADAGYQALTADERTELSEQLVADTDDLAGRVAELELTPSQLGNGAKELLDEVATGKVTGEEEIWSHTDLWDFQANVDGARRAFDLLEPALVERGGEELAATLDEEFDAVQALLDEQRDGDGFVAYTALDEAEVKALADAVNALAEPLSELTAVVR